MEKLKMNKLKEILRLKHEANLSARQIARALNVSHTVVNNYIGKSDSCNKSYDELKVLSDSEIVASLFPSEIKKYKYTPPDFGYIHKELKRKGVTLELLHEEYADTNPSGYYGYTWFCNEYKKFAKKLNPSMRQTHIAGEKVFIDFSGMTMPITNRDTGEISEVQIFVAVLGGSDYPFVKALASQTKKDFINVHVDMFKYFGGVPAVLVPDNLKSAVLRADNYDPDINPDYAAMARHYGCVVIPARSGKPKDKAKVENGVKIYQRWVLARLRNHIFFSIPELNVAINKLMPLFINKQMKRLEKSRLELFLEIDKPALRPLPQFDYEYREFKMLKVNIDYHIALEKTYYSVPYQLLHKKVEVWYSNTIVDIYYEGKKITTHPKSSQKGKYVTKMEHMASSHKKYLEWNPGKILNWGKSIGDSTVKLLDTIMKNKAYPEIGFKACMGILNLYKKYLEYESWDEYRLDQVSSYALQSHRYRVDDIKKILKNDKQTEELTTKILEHKFVRGSNYYS
jgi:transposase